ncbi:MAG: transposase [Candidatus Brocadiaceae bacterium]|nr:transposase [Candidatus Brocadiaceae bacterium]
MDKDINPLKEVYKTYGRSRSLRLKSFDYSEVRPYFTTICTRDKRPILKGQVVIGIIEHLKKLREDFCFSLYVYCAMPDHLHLLLSPGESSLSVSRIIQAFKSTTARWYNKLPNIDKGGSNLWQKHFYDHIVRREEDLRDIAVYILENPVRKGLVAKWEDYPFCGIIDRFE